jgi:carbamoyltransferase
MIVLGINHYTDPAACIIVDGKLIACVEEERFTRLKNSHNMFPGQSIAFCLKKANVSLDKVGGIAVPYNARYYPFQFLKKIAIEYFKMKLSGRSNSVDTSSSVSSTLHLAFLHNPKAMKKSIHEGLVKNRIFGRVPKIEFVDHHLCHAITAGYFSGFDSAIVLIIDGSGESNCTTLYIYKNGNLSLADKYEIPNSLGWFYAGITEFLGFQPYRNEGKTMGLAPYGKKDDDIVEKMMKILNYSRNRYSVSVEYLLAGKHSHGLYFSDLMVDLFGVPRQPLEPITANHKNIAWAAQYLLEECVKNIVNDAIKKYGIRNVCLAGGVAMNCKMNGSILYDTQAEDVFVFPAAGDSGSTVGAACYVSGDIAVNNREKLRHPYFGPSYSNDEILTSLKNLKIPFSKPSSITKEVAGLLEKGKLVAWFQGGMEFGSRALGNRSILANPFIPGIKDNVNNNVKYRENWRPFCPSLLDEDRKEYMHIDKEAPFMIIAHKLKDKYLEGLSSISHVDDSIRPQTVTEEQNPIYYELLREFKQKTGYGILLNTSLNVKGEPIICTPLEAIRCFYGNGLDALALGPYLLVKI